MDTEQTQSKHTLYDFSFKTLIGGKDMPLLQFSGKVVMIVNVASKCGFTGQYETLEKLYEKYKDQGFEIVGVPSNDFMGQEPGTSEEIAAFCSSTYGVTFPMTEKVTVIGKAQHPFFTWAAEVNGWGSGVKWNFHKYLFDRQGKAITYFLPTTTPDASQVVRAIEKALQATK